MGNDLVGVIIDAFKKVKPELTVMKIWNKSKLSIILAVHDPNNWEKEMDPYYAYSNNCIDGFTFIDNMPIVDKVVRNNYLIYDKTSK